MSSFLWQISGDNQKRFHSFLVVVAILFFFSIKIFNYFNETTTNERLEYNLKFGGLF